MSPVTVPLVDVVDVETVLPQPGHWTEQAACRGMDPDLFFPERGESSAPAKQVCRGCPVRLDCLDHALAVPERFGTWGGLSERERRRIRTTRRKARRAAEMAEMATWGGVRGQRT